MHFIFISKLISKVLVGFYISHFWIITSTNTLVVEKLYSYHENNIYVRKPPVGIPKSIIQFDTFLPRVSYATILRFPEWQHFKEPAIWKRVDDTFFQPIVGDVQVEKCGLKFKVFVAHSREKRRVSILNVV